MKRNILLLTLLVSTLQAQAYFKQGFYEDQSPQTVVSSALGGTMASDPGNPMQGMMNPAYLSSNSERLQIYAQMSGTQTRENRTFPVRDSFDSFLADNIYVQNHTFFANFDVGIRYNLGKIALSAGKYTRYDLNYIYNEEVRGSLYSVYNRDPLIGYHQVEFSGTIQALNAAVAINVSDALSMGLSYSLLSDQDLSSGIGVTVLGLPNDALASDTTSFFPNDYSMDNAGEMILGLRYSPVERLELQASLRLTSEFNFQELTLAQERDLQTGLPAYNQLHDSLSYETGIQLADKYSFGIHYKPANVLPTDLYFQIDYSNQDNYNNSSADTSSSIPLLSSMSFRAGVAHEFFTGVPFRVGFSYIPSPLNTSLNRSILTFGSGFHRDIFELDFAVNFTEFSYQYPDLFPIKGEIRNSLDTVKEQQIHYTLGLTVRL